MLITRVCCAFVHVCVCVITHQWNMKTITMRKVEMTSVRIHTRLYSCGVCRDTDHKWEGFIFMKSSYITLLANRSLSQAYHQYDYPLPFMGSFNPLIPEFIYMYINIHVKLSSARA